MFAGPPLKPPKNLAKLRLWTEECRLVIKIIARSSLSWELGAKEKNCFISMVSVHTSSVLT